MLKESTKLSFWEKSSYGFGDFASCLFWQTFSVYLMYFYTDVFGISGAAAGAMMLIVRSIDTFFDPIMGVIADRTNSRWGKFRPYLLWGAIPFGVIGVLCFTSPELASSYKLLYAYITYTAMMLIYSIVNIPYGALLGVITPNVSERTSLSSFRMVFAQLGGLVVMASVRPLVDLIGKGNEQMGWQVAMSIYAVLAIIMFLACFIFTRERVSPPKSQHTNVLKDFGDLFKNVPWIVLSISSLFLLTYVSVRNGSIAYYFKYYVQSSDFSILGLSISRTYLEPAFLVSGTIFTILGTMILSFFTNRFGNKKVYISSMLLTALITCAYYFIGKQDIGTMFLFQILINLIIGPSAAIIWAMYGDTADYSEWKTGRRATGLVYSSATMAQKFGWTIGGSCIGFLLGYFGFKANVVQGADAENGIRLLISFIPSIAVVASAVLMYFYHLNEKTMKNIETDLIKRRGKVSE